MYMFLKYWASLNVFTQWTCLSGCSTASIPINQTHVETQWSQTNPFCWLSASPSETLTRCWETSCNLLPQ